MADPTIDETRDARTRVQTAEAALKAAREAYRAAIMEHREATNALGRLLARPTRAARPGRLVWMLEEGARHTYITACGRYRVWRQEHVRGDAPLYSAERVSDVTPRLVAAGAILLGGLIKSGPERGDFPVGSLREAKESCQRHADAARGPCQ